MGGTSLATSWVVSMTAACTSSTTSQISSTRSPSALPSGRLPRTRAFQHEVIPWMGSLNHVLLFLFVRDGGYHCIVQEALRAVAVPPSNHFQMIMLEALCEQL